jgi:hypothetical protein
MATKIQLITTTAEFDRLHELADSRKDVVKVDRESLAKLLLDHSRILNALASSTMFTVQEPVQIRQRHKRKP